jgi:hypothetical protein
MNQPTIEPVQDSDLLDFCRFLTSNLSNVRSAEEWASAFRQHWGVEKPNNGFMLLDNGQIVGGIGAIYAQRLVHGKPEQFCNITSWCVLDQHRSQSMRLALALTSQPGFHFTDLTPTEVVSKMLQFLKFRPMNERQAVWPNLLWPFSLLAGVRVITDSNAIEQVLSPEDAKVYLDHRHLTWLNHLAVGRTGDFCHVVYKRTQLRGLPGAFILGFSKPGQLIKYRFALGNHLLFKKGLIFTRVESRLLSRIPKPSIELAGFRNKVFRSDTLTEADIGNLYTEIVALDL